MLGSNGRARCGGALSAVATLEDRTVDTEHLLASLEQAAAQLLLAAEYGGGRAQEMRELAAQLQVLTSDLDTGEHSA